ncbi:hypothetical protein [Mesorhizobium sp. M7D.F.Ca.US.005.01.1.1]|nr:hypothetical protein [Mesorhizobium sp. M7D.F.Ca.US.005.01.1.1]
MATTPVMALPINGATMKSRSWPIAVLPENSTRPIDRKHHAYQQVGHKGY